MSAKPDPSAPPATDADAYPTWPAFDEQQIDAAVAVLRSGRANYWTGTEGRAFEREFARFCQARFGLAVANGTLALELALHGLGIGPGDEVVVTSRSFVASASCVLRAGATPVFADVDRDSQALTAATVEAVLTPRTRAVIAVHLAGWPCDLEPLQALASRHGLRLIEDCAQAHGARYRGRPVGSFGCAAAFSFCHEKSMTTAGEGGMLLTSDPAVRDRALAFRDHGLAPGAQPAPPKRGFRFLRTTPGSNFRLSEVQSAVGREQLKRLPQWLATRERNARLLRELLAPSPALRMPSPPADLRHGWYKFYAFVRPAALKAGWDRERLLDAIVAAGVPCSVGACSALYREGAFDGIAAPDPEPAVAAELGRTSLMFCVHPTLEEHHMRRMASVIGGCLERASR
ncbi:MAG: DegT/DnrJ/EryC1/StrS family aminotransferase [Pseudomonadota bacterium]